MKPSEIREKSGEELGALVNELAEQLLRMRVASATSRDVNTSKFKQIRRDIARINTIKTERELGLTRE